MQKFSKLFTLLILTTVCSALPSISYAVKFCGPDGCFELECLPSEKTTLSKVEVIDLPMRKMCFGPKRIEQAAGMQESLAEIAAVCRKGGGTFENKNNMASCTIPTSATWGKFKMKSTCEKGGGVWAGNDGKGDCTGPRL